MAKSKSGGSRPPSSHPGPGGNWPSTTGRPSGRDRGNAPSSAPPPGGGQTSSGDSQ